MDRQRKDDFLRETLFHFLGSGDNEKFDVFDSIVRRGLLMTVGNKEGRLDRFSVNMSSGVPESFEVMQHARVCFTDIPQRMLSAHCEEYGKFGIGFSRKAILAWGGNPVIYLPNYPASGTLEDSMGTMLIACIVSRC
jgi:Putative abortive phage resistance protein AbiGi, antitoxin